MTAYVEHVNGIIRGIAAGSENLVCYGQNISAGSCLSGLTRGLVPGPGGQVLNTPNAENTLTGMGFGLMLRGVSSIFFMKQLDFLLLGLDHLVNTWNLMRRNATSASFTIVPVVVDSGYEGPQSSFNALADFCSLAQIPGYTLTNADDSNLILGRHLVAPGFRILAVSQRLFRTEAIRCGSARALDDDAGIIHYANGDDATIVAFNLSFPEAVAVHDAIAMERRSASLFSVNRLLRPAWAAIIEDARRTGRLIVLDDGKGANRLGDGLIAAVRAVDPRVRICSVSRDYDDGWLRPHADRMRVDSAAVLAAIGLQTAA